MAHQLTVSGAELDKVIAYRYHPPMEDIVDGVYTISSPLAVSSGTEYRLTFDDSNLARYYSNGLTSESGITRMYDYENNVAVYNELLDTPIVVALPNCWFQPSSANSGECVIRMYVNETSPILHDQAIVGFQGTSYEKMGDLFSYYLGDEVGYQLKSKGVYFTFEFTHDGNLRDMALFHYLT